jgi:hypothetical protein
VLKHDDAKVNGVSFAPDGRTIAVVSSSNHFSVVVSDLAAAPPLSTIHVSESIDPVKARS